VREEGKERGRERRGEGEGEGGRRGEGEEREGRERGREASGEGEKYLPCISSIEDITIGRWRGRRVQFRLWDHLKKIIILHNQEGRGEGG
jgi:hypothetical protein